MDSANDAALEEPVTTLLLTRAFAAPPIPAGGQGQKKALKTEMAKDEKNKKKAEGLVAKADALAQQGRIVVIESLAKKLVEVEIDIVPYQRREAPERLEIDDAAAAAAARSSKKEGN